jgi:hypothetical protein
MEHRLLGFESMLLQLDVDQVSILEEVLESSRKELRLESKVST